MLRLPISFHSPHPSPSSDSPSPFIPLRSSPSSEPARRSYTDEQAFDRGLRTHPVTYPPEDGRYSFYRAGNELPAEPPEELHWTSLAWVPHPFLLPNTSDAKQPYYGTDPETTEVVTGGHPLPGMDPFWSPARWVLPRSPSSYGISSDVFMVPNPRSWYAPQLLWDAAVQPPYCMQRVPSRGNMVDFENTEFFKTPATVPGIKSLINTPITIGDVFKKVWDYLHTQTKAEDWKALEKTYGEDWAKRVWDAFDLRCRTSGALYDWTKSLILWQGTLSSVYWSTYTEEI